MLMIQINQLFYEKTHKVRPCALSIPLKPAQIQAKKIYRVQGLPKGFTSPNIPKPAEVAAPSPPNEPASANNLEPRNSCNIF